MFPGPNNLRAFSINADQSTTTTQNEGQWRRTAEQEAEQEAERFMAEWITAEKAKAGLWHSVVCPNVTGRTKERIAQGKRARAVATCGANLYPLGGCRLVFLGCYVCFNLFHFRFFLFSLKKPRPFVQSFFVLQYACAPTATCSYQCLRPFLFFFGDVAFSEYFCTITVFYLYGEYAVRFFLPDGGYLPYDHGLDF